MLYLQFSFLLLFCLVGKRISSEHVQDQSCQLLVIRECLDQSLIGFLEAIESGNKDLLMKECDSLQATIDCFSIPRCPGNTSQAFRYFVLTAATTLKKSSYACPNLDVENLKRFVKGFSKTCEDNESVKDICDRTCKCENGKLVSCYRVRKSFTKMSLEERTRYIKAFKLAWSDPRYSSEFEKLGKMHTIIPGKKIFLPWHRWYVLEFENLLRQIDCRLTIPYWDWSKDAAHWTRGSEIQDAWNPGPHGLGGNGVFPFKCVMDGPFKMGEFSLPQAAGGFCLQRNFNYSCKLQNAKEIEVVVNEANFTFFVNRVFSGYHQTFHQCVGENLAYYKKAPYTPEFWLLHSFLDKLWVDWQNRKEDNKFVFFPSLNYFMHGTVQYPWEYIDVDQLPGDIHVSYEE